MSIPLKVAVVCEAEADYLTATTLAERVLCQMGDWVSVVLENCPLWWGLQQQATFLCWKDVLSLARARNVRSHGHFGDEPAAPDAHAARRVLRLLRDSYEDLDGVLLIRDDDRVTARRQGLEQAREDSLWRDRIVIGLAHCKRECWVLAGFDPVDDNEVALLESERQTLGFDPRLEAHQLTAKHDNDKRSAKRVLAVLTKRDAGREARCWETSLLNTLRQRSGNTGLADFLTQIEQIIGPRLTGRGVVDGF